MKLGKSKKEHVIGKLFCLVCTTLNLTLLEIKQLVSKSGLNKSVGLHLIAIVRKTKYSMVNYALKIWPNLLLV